MKKYLVTLALLTGSLSVVLSTAQAVVIQGETTPGVYTNVAVDSTGKLSLSATNPSSVSYTSLISTLNSSNTPLSANGVFTGTAEDVSNYSEARVSVFGDVASATDGMQMQQSNNGTNWDNIDSYTIPANTGKSFGAGIGARFFRIVYTNGGTIQTAFRLQVVYHIVRTKPSSVRPQDGRSNENDFEEGLSYSMIFNGTSWDRQLGIGGITTSKPYTVSANDWSYAAASGGIVNTTDVVAKTAAGAGIKNYITALTCVNAAAAVATEIVVKDGATVIWRGYTGIVAQGSSMVSAQFPNPLRGTANTAVNIAAITTAAQVYCNLQGYTGI